MLSSEEERRVRQHLRLARGLLDSAVLNAESSEFEERNALSRAYYAMYHACVALILSGAVEPSKSHGGLRDQVQRHLGKSFGQFMRDLYELRRASDYGASWTPIRHISVVRLKKARTNVRWACVEAEKNLR